MMQVHRLEVAALVELHFPFKLVPRMGGEDVPGLGTWGRLRLTGSPECRKWCAENFGEPEAIEKIGEDLYYLNPRGRWVARNFAFHFSSATDATAFKLVWG
jgi:hypothetical protein